MGLCPHGCHPRARGDPGPDQLGKRYYSMAVASTYYRKFFPNLTTLDPRIREDDTET